MKTSWSSATEPVAYSLRLTDQEIPLNAAIGSSLTLTHQGTIHCINCSRSIKKSFAQGYCYPCFTTLAETDMCIVKPQLCHHHNGTCRDNEFATKHCFIPHVVYLAVSSGLKVGITRAHHKITRWCDQGASYALEFATVPNRKVAGEVEVFLSQFVSDKTNWRKMLSNDIPTIDLPSTKADLSKKLSDEFKTYVCDAELHQLTYPVEAFPAKIKSHNLDKAPTLTDRLMGIKGQYLIFESCVINLRKYQGYNVDVSF